MCMENGAIYAVHKNRNSSSRTMEKQFYICRHFAEVHKTNITGSYFDNLTDQDTGRPGMAYMLADVAEKNIGAIIVVELSCIDPDIRKAGGYLKEMEAKGLRVISVEGLGGNLYDAENHFLPESIIQYLQQSGESSHKPVRRFKRGMPVKESNENG